MYAISLRRLGFIALILWAVLFSALLLLQLVPRAHNALGTQPLSFFTVAHAQEGGGNGGSDGGGDSGSGAGGGDGSGGVGGGDGGSTSGTGDTSGAAVGGSDGGGDPDAGAGGGCGDCGGTSEGSVGVDTAGDVAGSSNAGTDSSSGGTSFVPGVPGTTAGGNSINTNSSETTNNSSVTNSNETTNNTSITNSSETTNNSSVTNNTNNNSTNTNSNETTSNNSVTYNTSGSSSSYGGNNYYYTQPNAAYPYYNYTRPQPVYYNTYRIPSPTYYGPVPYVTLASVPYTGLDLGPWGTAFYWLFLGLWCVFGAYLIAIKRVQNRAAAWLKTFLFGEEEEEGAIA